MNLIFSVPQTAATTFAFSSVKNLILWYEVFSAIICSWIERKSQDDLIFIMDTLSKYYKSSLPITIGADKQYAVQVDDQSSVTASDCS